MSDQDSSIFETTQVVSTQNTQDQGVVTPQPSSNLEDLLGSIRKEDGSLKYKSAEDAIKSIPHAQNHIATLEKELQELREKLATSKTAEEILENFKSSEKNEKPSTPTVDLSQIESLLEQKLNQKEKQRIVQENISSVMDTITKVYGDKANEVFKKAAQDAGLPISEMNRLAASSPNAVFKLIGLDQKPTMVPARSSSSINTESLASQQQPQVHSAKVIGNTTKDLVGSWKNAGKTVKTRLGVE